MLERIINLLDLYHNKDNGLLYVELKNIVNEYQNMSEEEQYNILKKELVYPCNDKIYTYVSKDDILNDNDISEILKAFSINILNATNKNVANRLIEEDENNLYYASKNMLFRHKLNLQNKQKYINYLISNNSSEIISLLNETAYEDLFDKETLLNLLNNKDLMQNNKFLAEILKKLPEEELTKNIIKYKEQLSTMGYNNFIEIINRLPEDDRLNTFQIVFPNILNDNTSIDDNKVLLLKEYFKLLNDSTVKYQYIFNNFPKIYEIIIDEDIVHSYFRDLNTKQITSIIDKYSDLIINYPIFLSSILKYCDNETKIEYYNKYSDAIRSDKVAIGTYFFSLPSNSIANDIKDFKEFFSSENLINILFNYIKDEDKTIYLDNCIDKINRDELLLRFFYKYQGEQRKNYLKKYLKYFDEKLYDRYNDFKNIDENKYESIFNKSLMYNSDVFLLIINFHKNNLDLFDTPDKVLKSFDIIDNIINSNSSEIRHISDKILKIILSEPFEKWESVSNNIEEIFLKNNIPYVGKIYKVFELMHPDAFVKGTQSPNLNAKQSIRTRKIIIFSDLLKCSLGSNNRDFNEYLNSIINGNKILCNLINGTSNIADLNDHDSEVFTIYINHLNTLYNCTEAGLKNPRELKNKMIVDAYELLSLFMKNERNNFNVKELPNRIIRMFAHFAGFNTIDEIINYRNGIIKEAEERNIKRARENDFTIEKGDYYKGLVNEEVSEKDFYYSFLIDILQNGSVCKEFLGSAARSDTTPLDTDLSRIITDVPSFTAPFINSSYAASSYGPLWFVIKDNDRLNYSSETGKYEKDKLEIFETSMHGEGHYGIRTGFASKDIDYFVVDEEKVKLYRIENAIAMNGFYIPVVNTKGELVFTPEEYENLRKNMQGLSHYGCNDYEFAPELDYFDGQNEDFSVSNNSSKVEIERNLIINSLAATGLKITNRRMPYLENGIVELLDIGSTGRGTNCADNYDFDFILRVDRKYTMYKDKYLELRKHIEEAFPGVSFIDNFIIRELPVEINGNTVKIDITILPKDDKIEYTTDECVIDRLDTIKRINPEKHQKVLENIVLAKEVLKNADVYKSKLSRNHAQGGLGGVGIENWILQHGGSFERAARSFLEVANSSKDFEDFKSKYKVFDYGENHMYYNQSDHYKHFDFIEHNMDSTGYNKMCNALSNYINNLENKNKKEKQL